jgi:NADH-quinone oxidoreductase subunit G
VQVKADRVMRALPFENDAVNECWLSDRDRFSYEGLNSDDRLTKPLMKGAGGWKEVEWSIALQAAAEALKVVIGKHGADGVGALASPNATLEELYLLNKLVRALGSNNIDTRLRQADTSADGKVSGARWLGMKVADIGSLQSVLVVGSTLRKEQPLIANRLRQAAKKGLEINLLHAADDDLLMKVANKSIVRPSSFAVELAGVAKALVEIKGAALPGEVANAVAAVTVSASARAIAGSLASKEKTAVWLGGVAQNHPDYTLLHVLAQEIARMAGGSFGLLVASANAVGAAAIGAQPGRDGGHCAQGMVAQPRKALLTLGIDAKADFYDPAAAAGALQSAEYVVAMSAFKGDAMDYADIILPIAPFTETAGTFVNMEGLVQSFNGVVKPLGEARPAWKVLRVLGNMSGLAGFDQDSVNAIRAEIAPDLQAFVTSKLNNSIGGVKVELPPAVPAIERIGEVPVYAMDALVRRAGSLQKTADAKSSRQARLAGDIADAIGLTDGQEVRISQGGGSVTMVARRDAGLAGGTVRVAAALDETAVLGAMFGTVTIEKVAMAAAAE